MITTVEAARRLGITRQRVLELLRTGRIKASKFGRDWMVDEAAVAAHVRGLPGRKRKEEP